MKYIILVIALLACEQVVSGQSIKSPVNTHYSHRSIDTLDLVVHDATKGIVAYKMKDSGIVVRDSLATITNLFSSLIFHLREDDKLYAARDILAYLNPAGYVLNKNRRAFNKAVAHYFKLTHQKGKYHKMENLAILIRDANGNALGWVSQ